MDYLQYIEFLTSQGYTVYVLNLVINGLPSILKINIKAPITHLCFKPCYKWITFNTLFLNLLVLIYHRFKPCYKWITFNTMEVYKMEDLKNFGGVLNLVINGLPSILM